MGRFEVACLAASLPASLSPGRHRVIRPVGLRRGKTEGKAPEGELFPLQAIDQFARVMLAEQTSLMGADTRYSRRTMILAGAEVTQKLV